MTDNTTELPRESDFAPFVSRHIGVLDPDDQQRMLDVLGYTSLDALVSESAL